MSSMKTKKITVDVGVKLGVLYKKNLFLLKIFCWIFQKLGGDVHIIRELDTGKGKPFPKIAEFNGYIVLTDGRGNVIKGQKSIEIVSKLNEPSTAVVEFIIGGVEKE